MIEPWAANYQIIRTCRRWWSKYGGRAQAAHDFNHAVLLCMFHPEKQCSSFYDFARALHTSHQHVFVVFQLFFGSSQCPENRGFLLRDNCDFFRSPNSSLFRCYFRAVTRHTTCWFPIFPFRRLVKKRYHNLWILPALMKNATSALTPVYTPTTRTGSHTSMYHPEPNLPKQIPLISVDYFSKHDPSVPSLHVFFHICRSVVGQMRLGHAP